MDNPLEDADQPIGVDIGDFLTRVDDVQQIRKKIQKADSPQTGLESYRKGRYESKEAAKMQVLGLLRQGMTIGAAMQTTGRQRITFYGWCRESTKFRQQADEAMLAYQRTLTLQEMSRSQLNEAIDPIKPENFRNWIEYQVAFRKAYFGHDTFDHHWAMLEAIDKAPVGGVTMILIPPMSGKALAIDTPLPGPDGWTTMRDVKAGDRLFDENGKPCTVTFKSEVFYDHDCYEVRTSDGATVVADAGHLWPVMLESPTRSERNRNKRVAAGKSSRDSSPGGVHIHTTEKLAGKRAKRARMHLPRPLQYPTADLPIDPYALGAWLGDGHSAGGRITAGLEDHQWMRQQFEDAGYETTTHKDPINFGVLGLSAQLRALGLIMNKHVPDIYLYADENQRLALLQGLMDTDGYVSENGHVEFTSTTYQLAESVQFLVRSLGVKAGLTTGRATINGRDCGPKYRVHFMMEGCARLPRKAERTRNAPVQPYRGVSAEKVESVPTQCIQVDSPSHLFLCGDGLLVTHNTTLTLDIICADFCADPNTRACFISGGLDFSIKQMQRLQRRLVVDGTPTPFIQHFGPFPPASRDSSKKWNSQEITILGSTHDESDPTVGAYGITGNIRGTRWNRMYLDDVQSLRTKNLTTGMVEVFRGDIMTRPVKSGKILITGSRVGRGDFYEEMERLELVDEIVVIPAMDYSKPAGSRSYFPLAYTPDGQAITDESGDQMGFSDVWMETRRKQVGEDQWSRVYMMKPQSDHSAMLTEGDISNATDQDRFVCERPREAIANIASLDPSLAAYAAFTNCSYNVDHLYVVDVKNFFKPTTNQALYAEIEARTIKFRPDYWVIENNTLQRGYLTDDAFLAIKERYGFNAVGHHTGDNKRDSVLGIPAMMNAIVRKEILFPRITENDTDFAVLFDQLMSWRPDIPTRRLVQDMVMSLWFSYLLWRELREQAETDLSGWQRDGLDSITMYSHAKTNISLPQTTDTKRVAMTYEQTWQQLAGSSS